MASISVDTFLHYEMEVIYERKTGVTIEMACEEHAYTFRMAVPNDGHHYRVGGRIGLRRYYPDRPAGKRLGPFLPKKMVVAAFIAAIRNEANIIRRK